MADPDQREADPDERFSVCYYFLKAMFDPFIPMAEHVEPFHFPLSGNFHSGFLFTVTIRTLTLEASQ